MQNSEELTAQHGGQSYTNEKEREKQGNRFLNDRPWVAIGLLIVIVVLGQFWYQALLNLIIIFFGEQYAQFLFSLLAAVFFTVLFYILVVYVFKLPVTSII